MIKTDSSYICQTADTAAAAAATRARFLTGFWYELTQSGEVRPGHAFDEVLLD